jgi:hypothetical protein
VRLKIAYLLVRRILGLAVLVLRGQGAKEAELLVLRHKNAVLRRHAGWIQYEPADRVWFAALAPLLPRPRWTDIFPTPTTPTRASPRNGPGTVPSSAASSTNTNQPRRRPGRDP